MLEDYHLHSSFSFDGEQSMEELCAAAFARGLDAIAVTDHMDIYSCRPYGSILDCPACFAKLRQLQESYAGRMDIAAGIELGQPMRNPQEADAFLGDWPVDFIIGSVHNMEKDVDAGDYDYTALDIREVFSRYLDYLTEYAQHYDYDVLGHVIYPMRYCILQTGQAPDPMDWADRFEELFRIVIARGKGIELNTSSLARHSGILMPDLPLLRLYRSLGGSIITTGSDAHVASQTGTTAADAVSLLKEAGFTHLATYHHRNPILHRI